MVELQQSGKIASEDPSVDVPATTLSPAGLVHPEFAYALELVPQNKGSKRGAAPGSKGKGKAGAQGAGAIAPVFDAADAAAAVHELQQVGPSASLHAGCGLLR